jgi:predicted transposase/invertase (TIGR01784 family)
MPGLQSEFQVIRLWEQPLDPFLQSPGLLPFAILSQVQNPKQTLRTIAQALEKIPDQHQQSNLMASTAVLAGLILEKDTIYQTLRQDIMKESVIYQDIVATAKAQGIDEGEAKGRAEGEAKGRAEGEAKGRAEEKMQVAQNLLSLGMELPQIAQVTGLSIETLQQLQNRA